MNFVQSGLTLSFEVTYDSPSYFVGLMVLDDTGITPVQVGIIPMINIYGNTYRAKFLPQVGKSYIVNKAVYTDNTYTTIDQTQSQGSESFVVVDIASVVLDVMAAAHDNPGSIGEAIQAPAILPESVITISGSVEV